MSSQVLNIPTSASAVASAPVSAQGLVAPQFQFQAPRSVSTGDALSDFFLGTNYRQLSQNEELMNRANAFSEFMSDTQYQRTVADMLKAGINPVVAFGLGKGQLDSAPVSAQESVAPQRKGFLQDLFESILKLATSAMFI